MRKIQKKKAQKKLGFLLIILMLINEIPLYTRAEEQQGKEEAVFWLQKAAKTGQEWENL